MNKQFIKDHLLTVEYGRFDHIDQVIPKEVLLIAPPRTVVSYLVSELDVDKKDIPMPALRSWLFNYRKKTINTNPKPAPLANPVPAEKSSRIFTDTKGAVDKNGFDF